MKAIPIAALFAFCAMSAAAAQDAKPAAPADLPEGAAKAVVAVQCMGCHDLSRILNANHSAAEWRNVVNMMIAAGARLSPAEKDAVARYLIESFPESSEATPSRDRRAGAGFVPRVGGANTRCAAARSAGDAGRRTLVHGPNGQYFGPARSVDRRDQRISAEDTSLRPARPGRRLGRPHLVYGELRRLYR